MPDPARIDRILWLLTRYWRANPDLRLGQILSRLTPPSYSVVATDRLGEPINQIHPGDPRHVEDEALEAALREICDKELTL